MANFYPLNTPFINYYFYKAPFVNDAYSLTNLSVLSGGSGYALNDTVILGDGTYTNPAVIRVTGVTLGAITQFIITSNGKYSVTPTTFTQLATNGAGTGATFDGLVFAPNLYPIGPNVPLAGGFISFYEDENRTVRANTYSDVFDPQNPVVNPNPIQLGSSGDFPPIYMEDRLYYIVITDNTGDESNPVEVLEHFDPADSLAHASAFNDNFIVNPQFNYPITFYKTTDELGEITQPLTRPAWAWEFLEDEDTDSKNYITFEEILGLGIEGNPVNQMVIDCQETSSGETLKDARSYLGSVDFYNGNSLTFSAQMISLLVTPIPITISLEFNYGTNGSSSELIPLTVFNVGISRQKFAYSFRVPVIAGKTIGDGNYLALRIRLPLQTICKLGITNVMELPGIQPSAIFSDEPYGFSKAEILGEATQISTAGLYENYSPYYYKDGKIFPYANTGDIILCPLDITPQPFRHICDHASLKISDYNEAGIPYQRLYDKIGVVFGASGDLIVSSNNNVVTFSSAEGAREKTAYTAGTTTFVVTNTVIGLQFGISLVNNHDYTVTATFFDQFAPSQTTPTFGSAIDPSFSNSGAGIMTYWGTATLISPTSFVFTTLAAGSGVTNASVLIDFISHNVNDYTTRRVNEPNPPFPPFTQVSSFIEFASFAVNNRQPIGQYSVNQQILFSVDGSNYGYPGQVAPPPAATIASSQVIFVPFFSNLSVLDNIKTFVKIIANPFTWTVQVTVFPVAGTYFLYSSAAVDYYAWFTVDGAGTDPAVAGRTGVVIPIFSGQSTERVAEIIALTLNTATFNVPALTDLPALVASSKVSWFINL